jgi:hypothetical protein
MRAQRSALDVFRNPGPVSSPETLKCVDDSIFEESAVTYFILAGIWDRSVYSCDMSRCSLAKHGPVFAFLDIP